MSTHFLATLLGKKINQEIKMPEDQANNGGDLSDAYTKDNIIS
jgi:hypothetical protein